MKIWNILIEDLTTGCTRGLFSSTFGSTGFIQLLLPNERGTTSIFRKSPELFRSMQINNILFSGHYFTREAICNLLML